MVSALEHAPSDQVRFVAPHYVRISGRDPYKENSTINGVSTEPGTSCAVGKGAFWVVCWWRLRQAMRVVEGLDGESRASKISVEASLEYVTLERKSRRELFGMSVGKAANNRADPSTTTQSRVFFSGKVLCRSEPR